MGCPIQIIFPSLMMKVVGIPLCPEALSQEFNMNCSLLSAITEYSIFVPLLSTYLTTLGKVDSYGSPSLIFSHTPTPIIMALPSYSFCSLVSFGIAAMQGPHQVAQNSSMYRFSPLKDSMGLPLIHFEYLI